MRRLYERDLKPGMWHEASASSGEAPIAKIVKKWEPGTFVSERIDGTQYKWSDASYYGLEVFEEKDICDTCGRPERWCAGKAVCAECNSWHPNVDDYLCPRCRERA